MSDRSPFRQALSFVTAGCSLWVVLGLGFLGCRPSPKTQEPPRVRLMLPTVAFEMISDMPSVPIIDLRSAEEFGGELGHLPRAVSLPIEKLPDRLDELAFLKDQTFIVYCRREDDCGPRGALLMVEAGFRDAVLMEGGVEGWIRAGFGTIARGVDTKPMPMPEDPGHRIPLRAKGRADTGVIPDPP